MKTTHELATELLALPDVPVLIYSEPASGERPEGESPTASFIEGFTEDGDPVEVVELWAGKPVVAPR